MGASCYACVGGNNMKNEIQRLQGMFQTFILFHFSLYLHIICINRMLKSI